MLMLQHVQHENVLSAGQMLVKQQYVRPLLAQVPPLMDALFISPDVVRYLRGVGMLVVLALQFLALPQLVQVTPSA
jgi:hypothetical protein